MQLNPRNIAAYFFSFLLIALGKIKKVKKSASQKEIILSVYFHSPSKKLFEFCVKWFLNNGFTIISTKEIEAIAKGERGFPKSSVVLTVDDGWRSNKENIVAIAEKYKIPVTIFISTQPVETGEAYWWSYIAKANKLGICKYSVMDLKFATDDKRVEILETVKVSTPLPREALTINELKEIAESPFIFIGGHTVTHPVLTNCPDDKALFEIVKSKNVLETWLNRKVEHFAYPNGSFSDREIGFLKEKGYQLSFTTVPDYITPQNISNYYQLPRFDVLENISYLENTCRMTGVWFNRSLFKKN